MKTLYELTEAECEIVAGGAGGQIVALFNHVSEHGPGFFFHNGHLVSSDVHLVETFGPNVTVPVWAFLNKGHGHPVISGMSIAMPRSYESLRAELENILEL